MKKQLYLFATVLFLFSTFLISCSDDDGDGDGDPNKTATEKLTSGTWKVTAMTIDPGITFGGVTLDDFYAQMPACTQDDLMTFNTNGTITEDEGPTKCNPNDPQTTTDGTWTLSSDDTMLTIDDPEDDTITITITSLTDTGMTGTYIMEEDFGVGMETYTITISLTKV